MLTISLLFACQGVPDAPVGTTLPACWTSPNCVSSQADPSDAEHYVSPLPLAGLEELAVAAGALPGCVEEARTEVALRFRCDTPSGLYTDDLDLVVDAAAGVVHVRSSSRIGRRDFGVNRERVEALRASLD